MHGPDAMMGRAAALAAQAHREQVDKQGRGYFEHHLVPVAKLLEPFGEIAVVAGLLHDILEDTPTTVDDLRRQFPAVVVSAVESVTQRPGETYREMIARAAAHPIGRLVKLADNWLNLTGLDDLATTAPATAERLRGRYVTARRVLLATLDAGSAMPTAGTPCGTDLPGLAS